MLIRPEHCYEAERAEVSGTSECFRTAQRLFPHPSQAEVAVAGGVVRYFGPGSFLNEAGGMGLDAPVTSDDIATIVTFFGERGEPAHVMAHPLADPSLGRLLASSGFEPIDIQNVLIADLGELKGAYDPRVRRSSDAHAWALANWDASSDGEPAGPHSCELAETIASVSTVVPFELLVDGAVAAVAVCGVSSPMGGMFFATTMPWARGRGLQFALIRHRIRTLQEAGVQRVRSAASPASVSERNFRRAGMTVACARTLWERK